MKTVPVALGKRSYDIHIEQGLLGRAGEVIAPLVGKRPVVVVADRNVKVHLSTLRGSLEQNHLADVGRPGRFSPPAGADLRVGIPAD